MTKVFIAGSRRLSRLNADVKRRIDIMIEKGFTILVGDANGADKAVQRYLVEKGYRNNCDRASVQRFERELGIDHALQRAPSS